MTFTFKLSRRMAGFPWLASLLVIGAAACAAADASSNNDPTGLMPVSLDVLPHSAAIRADQSVNFRVQALTDQGQVLGVDVTWQSSGGTVTPAGGFHADTPGSYLVIATEVLSRIADTSSVTVSPIPPDSLPASIVVSPSTATVDTGATIALAAWGVTALGDSVPVGVSWSTSGGSITSNGVYQSPTAGTFKVIAVMLGGLLADTATVTVVAPAPPPPPPPSGLTNECAQARPEWVWCDDFDQDRLTRYFEHSTAGGSFTRVAGVGNEGSSGMRAKFSAGQVDAGYLHVALGKTPQAYFAPVDAGTANYRELYWRFYVKHQAGWTGGGGNKLTRATSFASSSSWAQAMIAHVWSGGTQSNYLTLDPASGTDVNGTLQTTTYNDFPNLRWLGAKPGNTPVFDAAHVGAWYCVEVHVKLNDAGVANGVFDLWVNGSAESNSTGLNWVGSFNQYGINAVYLENYWNNGSPVAQERYLDNFVVSTARIGC